MRGLSCAPNGKGEHSPLTPGLNSGQEGKTRHRQHLHHVLKCQIHSQTYVCGFNTPLCASVRRAGFVFYFENNTRAIRQIEAKKIKDGK